MAFRISGSTIIDDTRNLVSVGIATISTIFAGSATTTGTVGQALQVGSSGSPNGVYISGNTGIGSTNPGSRLAVIGDAFVSGVVTATQLISNVLQGTAPISVASSTLVSNLNAQYLNSQPGSFYQVANNLTGTAPANVISQSSGLTITGNLNVSGNVSVSGTTFLLNASTLQVQDRDIVLGLSTNASGADISTDATATHGGVSVASTVGTPIFDMPQQAGINSLPSTYKQFMWISNATAGSFAGVATDAWISNYAIGIGTLTVRNGSRLTVGAGFTVFDTYLDAQDIRARNVTAAGFTTSGGFNATTGNDYKINGTSVLTSTTLGSAVVNSSLTSVGTLGSLTVTGATTSGGFNATAGNDYKINSTSVLTSTTLGSAVVNSSLTSVGTLGSLTVTGATTSGGINVTTGNDYKINSASVLTSTTLGSSVVNSSLTSVGTLPTLNVTSITTNTNINSSGIHTASQYFVGATSVLTSNTLGSGVVNSSLTSVGTLGSLTVTGATTSGGINVTTGNDYKINSASVLTSTTLGSSVVNSSLTSVGTLGSLTVTGPVTASGGINVTGIVTASAGFNAGTGSDYEINGTSVLTSTTLGSGVVNSSLTSVGTLATLNVTNITTNTNINSSGINTAAQFNIGATTVLATVNSQIRLSGIATIDATTRATLERELAFAPNDFDSLNVGGISSFKSTTLIGSGTSTGTANQVFQVTGISSGAYIGGSLGIAVTNPTRTLDVNGDVRFRSGIRDINDTVGSASSVLTANGSGGWSWQPVSASGAISGITITDDTSTATPKYLLFTGSTSGSVTAENVSSTKLSYIASTGSLGVNTASPSQPLDVNGNVRFRSGIYDSNNTVGSASSVLTANGSGGWSWQPPTASGGAAIAGINVTQDDTGIRYPLFASGTNATTTAQYIDATALVYNSSTNCLGIGTLTPTSKLDIIGDIRVSGIVTAGDFNSTSDRKLKTNIKTIENPIEKVLQISGVSFNWKESGKATMGVIAQEVELVLPELVSDTDPKTVNYNGLIGLLIECVKDQQRQIDELKNK